MRTLTILGIAALATAVGCTRGIGPKSAGPLAPAAAVGPRDMRLYVATLTPQNPDTAGRGITGTASFVARGDQLDVTLDVRGLADGRHIAMVQGFADGRDAACPTPKDDRNRDGIVDAVESRAVAGVPLIPLNFGMSMLEYESDNYPEARSGRLRFEHATSQSDLLASLSAEQEMRRLAIENYTVVVYGVSEASELPPSVQALSDASRWQSVPIACGVVTGVR